jgi:hypothetical protein
LAWAIAAALSTCPLAVGEEARPNALSSEEQAEGWLLLFDGETKFGWRAATDAQWKVERGVISVESGEPGLLCTTTPFADFRLMVDFRATPETNSGVFLRTVPRPTDPSRDCYELNIATPAVSPFPTGSFVGRKKADPVSVSDQWRTFDVTARGGHFQVSVDGKLVLEYDDPQAIRRGLIGLQFNRGKIEFRNIKLLPLGLESIFNGRDLTGWQAYPGKPSVFAVNDAGELTIKNGPGQLESEYADFCLRLDVFVNGKGLNSGVFFRSLPGELWQGYEAQIQNAYKETPEEPVDCGTGGFYRRQNARRIVARDFEWFVLTVIAAENHFAAWVNGYPVSDWTDERAPHANPRQGLRLERGTLILQGHDPTTDLRFRNLRVSELAR